MLRKSANNTKESTQIILALIAWSLAIYFGVKLIATNQENELIEHKTYIAQIQANGLADNINHTLDNTAGISKMLTTLLRVMKATNRFGDNVLPSKSDAEKLSAEWTNDRDLNDLSRFLASAQKNLGVDLIFVLNAAGDCIAASNWNSDGSPIGHNYAEREFFEKNRNASDGMQFAVGKTTHIPGLFFGSPVIKDGKFMGAVVTKIDVSHLHYLIKTIDAFLVDNKGVITLSHEQNMMLNAIPSGSVYSMSGKEIFDRYRTYDIPKLEIRTWQGHPNLKLFQHEEIPSVVAEKALTKYGLTVFVENEIPSLITSTTNRYWITSLLILSGSITIVILFRLKNSYQRLRSTKELLWHRANFDYLTGLPNRNYLRTFLQQKISSPENEISSVALLIININKFKEINLRLGNRRGDQLIKSLATRLATIAPSTDALIRREGRDEFYLVLTDVSQTEVVVHTAQRILQLLEVPFNLRMEHIESSSTTELIKLSATIGISFFPTDAKSVDDLIANAEIAMHTAKSKGKNYQIFTSSIYDSEIERIRMIEALELALRTNQLEVHFEPIVNLATGHVYKAEALLRWNHPTKGLISPSLFIPLAEKNKLIIEIGKWVRAKTVIWVSRWKKMSPYEFQVSINKSPSEFSDDENTSSLSEFSQLLQQNNLRGENFVFEITEGLLINRNPATNKKLAQIKEFGIQLALDDFGTGYSSFSYLATIHADYLKIDQSLVKNIEQNSNNLVVCQTIILMGHKLGMKIIAEGVETAQQRDLLKAAGCDYAQGWLYSKALPAEEFERWFIANNMQNAT